MSEGIKTTDHDTIRKWAEDRGGIPVTVADTARGGEEAGLLRIDFPGHGAEEGLEPISWDDFFSKFDEKNLAFLYQEQTESGANSRFCKFVER